MAGRMQKAEKDLTGQTYKACENVRVLKPTVIHYIIHQHVVRKKYLNPSYYWTGSVSGELNHRHFCEFLSEIETEFPDSLYHLLILTS